MAELKNGTFTYGETSNVIIEQQGNNYFYFDKVSYDYVKVSKDIADKLLLTEYISDLNNALKYIQELIKQKVDEFNNLEYTIRGYYGRK